MKGINDDVKLVLGMLAEELARLLVSVIAVLLLYILLLTGMDAVWSVYTSTDMGKSFLAMSVSGLSEMIVFLVAQPKFEFALRMTLDVLMIVLPLALAIQFTHVRHYLYTPMPLLVKGVWVLLVAYGIAAGLLPYLLETSSFGLAYIMVLPAVLCFLPMCLMVAERVLPDLMTTLVRTTEWVRNIAS